MPDLEKSSPQILSKRLIFAPGGGGVAAQGRGGFAAVAGREVADERRDDGGADGAGNRSHLFEQTCGCGTCWRHKLVFLSHE